jgi:ABC-2 type transport system ATP-binding protein
MKSGTITINGYDIVKDFEKAIESVGAIVENPDMYMYLSGRKNLEMIARMYRGISKDRINEVIKLVGLENRINDKVSKYSLGMRQRLGIAAALMHNPKLLILDEPTNGLDPEGIKDLRGLLKSLAKNEKIGVLISSHNLAELDSFCTSVCIIKNGEIIESSSVKEVKKMENNSYLITLDKVDGIEKLLDKSDSILDKHSIRVYKKKEDVSNFIKLLLDKGYNVFEYKLETLTLEEAFLKKAGGNKID